MQHFRQHAVKVGTLIGVLGLCLVLAPFGCGSESKCDKYPDGPCWITNHEVVPPPPSSISEFSRDGTLITLGTSVSFSGTHDGAKLNLWYDSATSTFEGSVRNTTETPLLQVKVTVHLSNGLELGPPTPLDLAPGELIWLTLPAGSQHFSHWSTYLEVP